MLRASTLLRRSMSSGMKRSFSAMSEIDEMRYLLGDRSVGSLYDYEAKNAAGNMVPMSTYKGKPVLISNVASL